jgi:alpha-L-fucosidase
VPAWGAPHEYAEWYWHQLTNDAHHSTAIAAVSMDSSTNVWWKFHVANYGEHFDYTSFAPMFRCELFNADQWASLFYRSGAKYVVPTSKHHEGFALWPSAEASRDWGRPWNSVEVGPKRDLIGELATAVRKQPGMHFGFYYSLYEWYNPLWVSDKKRYVTEHMLPQIKDVVTRYSPDILFSDGEWDLPSKDWHSEEFLAWLFNDSPCKDTVVVNDRWGKETRGKHGTYFTTEYGAGMKDASHPWEENRGIGFSFGYNRAENIDDYKTGRELVFVLVDLVSRGGNLLLDIGPRADGGIPVVMQDRLAEIGDWLKVNGEAIYGSRTAGRSSQWSEGKRPGQEYGRFKIRYDLMSQIGQVPKGDQAVKQAFFTQKPDALYAISTGWPGSRFVLHNITVPAGATVTLLGYPEALKYATKGSDLEIELPNLSAEQIPCKFAYTFKIPGATVSSEN